jgi:hypothetical protein
MHAQSVGLIVAIGLILAVQPALALPGDIDACLDAGYRSKTKGPLGEDEQRAGHEACQRALADSSNIMEKYGLQEADFDIVGRPN